MFCFVFLQGILRARENLTDDNFQQDVVVRNMTPVINLEGVYSIFKHDVIQIILIDPEL